MPSALFWFGRQLNKLREERKISQEKLEDLCDFGRQHVGRLERGERIVSLESMMKIAFVLKVKPHELYKQIPIPDRMPKKGEYKGQKPSATKKSSGKK